MCNYHMVRLLHQLSTFHCSLSSHIYKSKTSYLLLPCCFTGQVIHPKLSLLSHWLFPPLFQFQFFLKNIVAFYHSALCNICLSILSLLKLFIHNYNIDGFHTLKSHSFRHLFPSALSLCSAVPITLCCITVIYWFASFIFIFCYDTVNNSAYIVS
jgi:hypothetical protein